MAQQLGVFLEKLHTYPVDRTRAVVLPEVRNLIAGWQDTSSAQLHNLDDMEMKRDRLRRYLEDDALSNHWKWDYGNLTLSNCTADGYLPGEELNRELAHTVSMPPYADKISCNTRENDFLTDDLEPTDFIKVMSTI